MTATAIGVDDGGDCNSDGGTGCDNGENGCCVEDGDDDDDDDNGDGYDGGDDSSVM